MAGSGFGCEGQGMKNGATSSHDTSGGRWTLYAGCLHVIFWSVFFSILVLAGWARFAHIKEIGFGWEPDGIENYVNAKAFQNTIFGHHFHRRFHPVPHIIYGQFFSLLGDTDYTVKIANCIFDLFNTVLVFALAAALLQNRWISLSPMAMYALAPKVLLFARREMTLPVATFWSTLAFFCLLGLIKTLSSPPMAVTLPASTSPSRGTGSEIAKLFSREPSRLRRALFWLAAMGAFLGFGVCSHYTVAFAVPGYMFSILVVRLVTKTEKGKSALLLVRDVTVFGVALALVALVFCSLFPLEDFLRLFQSYQDAMADQLEKMDGWVAARAKMTESLKYESSPIDLTFTHVTVGLRHLVASDLVAIFFPSSREWVSTWFWLCVVGAVVLGATQRTRDATLINFPILLIVFSYAYGMAYVTRTFIVYDARYLLHIFPVILAFIHFVPHQVYSDFLRGRGSSRVFVLPCFAPFFLAAPYMILPNHPDLKEPVNEGKRLYKVLGNRVDENNLFLVFPHASNMDRWWFEHPLYFGANAIFFEDVYPPPATFRDRYNVWNFRQEYLQMQPPDLRYNYPQESLAEFCRRANIRYVYKLMTRRVYYWATTAPPTDEERKQWEKTVGEEGKQYLEFMYGTEKLWEEFRENTGAKRIYFCEKGALYELDPARLRIDEDTSS